MSHVILKDYPHHLTKYGGKGTSKITIFQSNSLVDWKKLEKTWKYTQLETKFQNSNFESVDEVGNVMS